MGKWSQPPGLVLGLKFRDKIHKQVFSVYYTLKFSFLPCPVFWVFFFFFENKNKNKYGYISFKGWEREAVIRATGNCLRSKPIGSNWPICNWKVSLAPLCFGYFYRLYFVFHSAWFHKLQKVSAAGKRPALIDCFCFSGSEIFLLMLTALLQPQSLICISIVIPQQLHSHLLANSVSSPLGSHAENLPWALPSLE